MARRDLTVVGLTGDGRRLVLVSDSGEEYAVAADARLRAALRGEHARLGQLEITMESALRPRDIQARIRAGETPEKVAAAAQTTVDRIMAFAGPVLDERAHIALLAQQASVRRSGGPSRVLADAVAERLRGRNVEPGAVEWDAWRRDDGRWMLVADYRSGDSARHAEFVYDVPGRYVVADDDEARWLVGEQSTSHGPQPRAATGRRLSAVPADEDGTEDQLPLGEDAIDLVSDDPPPVAGTVGHQAAAQDSFSSPTADWLALQASERPEPAAAGQPDPDPLDPAAQAELGSEADEQQVEAGFEPTPEPVLDAALESPPESGAGAGEPGVDPAVDPGTDAAEPAAGETPAEADPEAPKRGRKGRRASVPSWDEIMFGGGKAD